MRLRALALCLMMGCGRLGFGDGSTESEPGENLTDFVDETSSVAPDACESIGGLATLADSDVDLAVATTPTGATLVWVPVDEGSLRGLDLALDRSAGSIVDVRVGPYSQSSIAYVDGRLIATARSTTRAIVHDVPQPLAAGTEIANMWGDHLAKAAIVRAGGARVMAVSCSQFALHAFNATWDATENSFNRGNSFSSDHLAVTELGAEAFSVVSMTDGCAYATATSASSSMVRESPAKCSRARLASSGSQVAMAFESGTDVSIVVDDASTVTAANALPVTAGSSPRILHHGGRYWLSYLDDSGGFVVGVIDGTTLLTRRLAIPATAPEAYELAIYDGQPWLFTVDPQSAELSGHRLCMN